MSSHKKLQDIRLSSRVDIELIKSNLYRSLYSTLEILPLPDYGIQSACDSILRVLNELFRTPDAR